MIRCNGLDEAFLDETLDALLVRLNIDPRGIAVALDGEVVRRSDWATTRIKDGCSIEIVTAAAGG